MAEFRLGRLKFNWRGSWTASTAYVIDDIVQYGANLYVCVVNHTSTTSEAAWYDTDFNIGTPKWELHVPGQSFRGDWVGLTTYKSAEIVRYGNNLYSVNTPHYSVGAGITLGYFTEYLNGFQAEGSWSSSTPYQKGDVVYYKGSGYVALTTSTNSNPILNLDGTWTQLVSGISTAGISTYSSAVGYERGMLVTYGGDTYVGIGTTIPQGALPTGYGTTSSNNWSLLTRGLRYAGTYQAGTTYQINDIVSYTSSSYVSVASSNVGNTPGSSPNWGLLADGNTTAVMTNKGDMIIYDSSPQRLGIGSTGTFLRSDGNIPAWDYFGDAPNVYYVSKAGQDWAQWGQSWETSWKTIGYAVTTATTPCVIHVAAGEYEEQIPIRVKPFTDLRGASQRAVVVKPAAGLSTQTMFMLSDATTVSEMTLFGLTGWAKTTGDPLNVIQADTGYVRLKPAGTFFAFNPDSPILTKSPYVKECTGIGTGAVGAYLDGNLHGSGNKSIVFHSFTCVNDQGVGYWVNNLAKAEVVSGFTYWCDYGYLATNGGIIRALNGNNSYGTWGSSSIGYSQSETAKKGVIDGAMLEYQVGTLTVVGAGYTVGAAITGEYSGASGVVIYDIPSTNRIIYRPVGLTTFIRNEPLFIGGGMVGNGATAVTLNNNDFETGIRGYLLPLKGLTEEPRLRGGIQFIGVSTAGDRRTAGPRYGPAASGEPGHTGAGATIGAGIGSDTNAYVVAAVSDYIPPSFGLAGYAGTYYQGSLGVSGTYPSVQVSAAGTGTGAFLNVTIGGSGNVTQLSISTAGQYYTELEQITIDGTQIGAGAGAAITFSATVTKGSAIIRTATEKVLTDAAYDGQHISIRYDYSNIRLTGHDFLEIGLGGRVASNYPLKPLNSPIPGNQVIEGFPGRVYYVTTDQEGNFKVGNYFAVDQATGSATLNANAFNLSGLTSLRLGAIGGQIGESINEFSSDTTMSGNSNSAVPTEYAVKTYVDRAVTLGRGFAYWIATL